MLPLDTSPQSRLEYLTRMLSALCVQSGGELRIPGKIVRELEQAEARQAMFYDENLTTDEIVLRFGTKNAAVFPVEPCRKPKESVSPQPQSTQTQTSPPMDGKPQVRKPWTEERLAAAEKKIRAARIVAQMRREANESQPQESFET